jgi:hypothetical protein
MPHIKHRRWRIAIEKFSLTMDRMTFPFERFSLTLSLSRWARGIVG